MATVNWTSSIYGFDFRKLLLSYVSPSFGGKDPTSFQVLDIGPGGYGPARDTYHGSFTYGILSSDVSGIVSAITRLENNFTSTVIGLNLQVSALSAAAGTVEKEDDLQIWSAAFSGDDQISGGDSQDRLEGFAGNDILSGGVGNDTLDGGMGSDTLTADAGDDLLDGGAGLDTLFGGDGKDSLYGQADQDLLLGGRGADNLYGGHGNDAFIFISTKDSTTSKTGQDTIYDFSSKQKDKVDLKGIDANTKAKGNQALKFIGTQEFHKKPGELRYEKTKGGVYVYGDVNGDGKADLSIFLKNVAKLAKGDFYL